MGQGLSPLQRQILAVLERWPTFEQATPGYLGDWALPRDIIEGLGLPKNNATRASLSKALLRLHDRGLVARSSGQVAKVGKSFWYVRIAGKPESEQ